MSTVLELNNLLYRGEITQYIRDQSCRHNHVDSLVIDVLFFLRIYRMLFFRNGVITAMLDRAYVWVIVVFVLASEHLILKTHQRFGPEFNKVSNEQ